MVDRLSALNSKTEMAQTSRRVGKIASRELKGKPVASKGRKSVAGAALRERRKGK